MVVSINLVENHMELPPHKLPDSYLHDIVMVKNSHLLFCEAICHDSLISDSLTVAHQSQPTVYIKDHRAVPLYCIASNHSLHHTYQWTSISGSSMPASTPVLWVSKASTYKCVISQSGNSNKCSSANICVQGLFMI